MQRYLATPFSLLNLVFDALELSLAVRFLLKLFGANAANYIVSVLYNVTAPFVRPFSGIFRDTVAEGLLVEWSTILAMVAYGILAVLFVRLLLFFTTAAAEDEEDDYKDATRHHHA